MRMLFLITHLQSSESVPNISRAIADYKIDEVWDTASDRVSRIIASRYVILEAFAFMTNHLHLAVCEAEEHGIVRYMQRVLNAYAKYANTRYETVGHIFQGPYRATHIGNNDQLLYLSAYIHRNPRKLHGVVGSEHQYRWSSYRDYLGQNRFGELLDPSLVLDQFETTHDYQAFVDTSIAKDESYRFSPF